MCVCVCGQPHRNPCFSSTCGSNPRKSINKRAPKKRQYMVRQIRIMIATPQVKPILFRVFKEWYIADRPNLQTSNVRREKGANTQNPRLEIKTCVAIRHHRKERTPANNTRGQT
mmetsp:Transcript_88248/g.142792  ORF Transcript_88248/g.142792 Transcript_88248/m.142792 type:complete len:114 (-) Transcript_88248:64-405(-)